MLRVLRTKVSVWTLLLATGTLLICVKIILTSYLNPQDEILDNAGSIDVDLHMRTSKNGNSADGSNIHIVEKESRVINFPNRTIVKEPPPGTQMGTSQIEAIRKVIKSDTNLLVWGLGNDSPFWHDCTGGKVIFIEPAGFWYDKILNEYPYLEAYTVKYTTKLPSSYEKYINRPDLWGDLDLRSELPPPIKETKWDVIIVDAPPGYNGAPGRFQSIYTSLFLAQNGTHIFVDDYERKVEHDFSNKMLGAPIEVIDRPAKGPVGRNKQAHFIHMKK